jgi:CubicO group peptidase (beta-lactamase class C family)
MNIVSRTMIAMLLVLGISVQMVLAQDAGSDANYADTIEQIAAAVEEQYPIEAKAISIAADLRHAASDPELNSPVSAEEFVVAMNKALWDSAHDLHLKVQTDEAVRQRMEKAGGRVPRMRRVAVPDGEAGSGEGGPRMRMPSGADGSALGTTKIDGEMLNSDTGLITISSGIYNNQVLFTDVLSSLSDANNIILDLRKTPGGTVPGVQYFLSQFYGESTHLSSQTSRVMDAPRDMYTIDTAMGDSFADKDIYVLTGQRTASGAEAVSYAIKETDRGILIGEKTAGAGNAGAFIGVGSGLSLFLPISQTLSPKTGLPWEGQGVKPHITAVADNALEVALKVIEDGLRPGDAGFGATDVGISSLINAYVNDLSAKDTFSGAVLVAKDGAAVSSIAVGEADKSTGRKNTADTPINLGSTNKMFTGVAVAQLVEQGLIDWQDTVGKFLPDYPNATVRDEVTIEHLLTHTSGTEAFADQDDFVRYRDVTTVAGLMDIISDNPLAFAPGTDEKYSNAGPWILGRIIEVVTGEDYYDYIQVNVFDVAGMENSGFYYRDDTTADFARGYLQEQEGPRRRGAPQPELKANGEWKANKGVIGKRGSPSGSAYSSTNDMLRFANAMNGNALISADSFKTLTTLRTGSLDENGYGYLFRLEKSNTYPTWGHSGGGPGIQADFRHIPSLGYTIIVLSNYGNAAMPVSEKIQELLTSS